MAKRKKKGCHGHGGKCANKPTVTRGLSRWCDQCADPPEVKPLGRVTKAGKVANAVADLRVRDYDDPHNRVAREAD